MTSAQRKYKMKDVDMIITSSTILETAATHQGFLQQHRSDWSGSFFTDLQADIDKKVSIHLGIDTAKDLREATAVVIETQTKAVKSLANLKVQIVEDFKQDPLRRDQILKSLGYATYTKLSQTGNQQDLIGILFQFKQNMSDELKKEICMKGTMPKLIDDIIGYADAFKAANITQESFKSSRKSTTHDIVKDFNEIYHSVIKICKMAQKFFDGQPHVQEQFVFSKVGRAISAKASPGTLAKAKAAKAAKEKTS